MKEWWYNLAARERIYLGSGAIVVALMLFYAMVVDPIFTTVGNLGREVPRLQEDLQWMQQTAVKIREQEGKRPRGAGRGSRSLLATVDQAVNNVGSKSAVQRMEPEGRDGVKLWFKGVGFDPLLAIFGELQENEGIVVTSLSVTPSAKNGMVDARATLSRGGS